MFQRIISRPIVRIAAATCVAGAVALAVLASRNANAGSQVQEMATQAYALAGQLRVPMRGNQCSVHGWPNFEPKCQFDLRVPDGGVRIIRVIALR